MPTQYRLVHSGKTASGGQGSSEPVAPRIIIIIIISIIIKDVSRIVKSNSIGICFINSLKSEREREREREVGGSVRHYILKRWARYKFTTVKVPRQIPLALLVKVGCRGGKTFDCEEGIDER
jgi:hypothetical protein